MKQIKIIFSITLFFLSFYSFTNAQGRTIKVTLEAIECVRAPNINSGGDKNMAVIKGTCSSQLSNSREPLQYLWKTNTEYDYTRIPIGGKKTIGKTIEYKFTSSDEKTASLKLATFLHLLETDKYEGDFYAIADNFGKRTKTLSIPVLDIKNNSEKVIIHQSSKSTFKFIFKFEVIVPKILKIEPPKILKADSSPVLNGKLKKEPIKIPNSEKLKKDN